MYSIGRRATVSAIIPVVLLVAMIGKILYQQNVYAQAVNAGYRATNTPFDSVMFTYFILTLVLVYILSVLFFSLETIIKLFITDKDSPESIATLQQLKNVSLKEKIKVILYLDNATNANKVTHSILFQGVLLIICLFACTSSSSVLGMGLALSLLLQTVVDQAVLIKNKQYLSSWFWQIGRQFPVQLHQLYFGIITILSLLCLYFGIR